MIGRFSLYGFLKNQRYFEPFLVLAFLDKGLSYLQIGTLIGFRELCVNLMEIPTGAIADLHGRRKSMILSFAAYIASFLLLAEAAGLPLLFLAMFLFAIGEAFRTGTHKAMIFDWLAREGRQAEKTKVYGYTRSWSQIGSALSVLIAAGIVLVTADYAWVFWLSCLPYAAGIVNFLTYPAELDGTGGAGGFSLRGAGRHVAGALRACAREAKLRRLMLESMFFSGGYAAAKDYLQPLLRNAALLMPIGLSFELAGEQRAAVLVGAVYSALYLLSAAASRLSERLRAGAGGEDQASAWTWWTGAAASAGIVFALAYEERTVAILLFVLLAMLQNAWRPLFLGRLDEASESTMGATLLSIDSQAKSLFLMVAAPVTGWAVDRVGLAGAGVCLLAAALLTLLAQRPWKKETPPAQTRSTASAE